MQGTFFFVHGTGVRQEGYDGLWAEVQERAQRNGITGVDFVGCAWGPARGVALDRVAATLPQEATRSATEGGTSEAQLEAAAWALLIDDPLFELRLLGQAAATPASPAGVALPNQALPEQVATDMLRGVRGRMPDLTGTGLGPEEVADAAEAVAGSPELRAAARGTGAAVHPDLVRASARAIVARILATHRDDPPGTAPRIALDADVRDTFALAVERAIAPDGTRGVGERLKELVRGFVERKATAYARERRHSLTGMSLPAVGDILFYQRRGEGIKRFVADALLGLRRPVVAVGHSLGGVILVDLLSQPEAPPVDYLVTAGSQPPVFFALDALERLRPTSGGQLPFTPWLNIYDPNDFLSYCAARVFASGEPAPSIRDVEVGSGVPFPEAHGAYWYNDRVYALIRESWPTGRQDR